MEPQLLDEPVQLIKEIPGNAVVRWYGTFYPGSEYYRLTIKDTMPRIYRNKGKLRQAITTITEGKVLITGGGIFGRPQLYEKDNSFSRAKYYFYIKFFDALEEGHYIGW